MLNKKKIGLGMILTGGLISITGLVVMNKHNKEKDELLEELSMTTEWESVDENTMQPYEMDTDGDAIAMAPYKVEIPVEFKLTEKNIAEAHLSTSTYNPTAEPVPISQEKLESLGNTF